MLELQNTVTRLERQVESMLETKRGMDKNFKIEFR